MGGLRGLFTLLTAASGLKYYSIDLANRARTVKFFRFFGWLYKQVAKSWDISPITKVLVNFVDYPAWRHVVLIDTITEKPE